MQVSQARHKRYAKTVYHRERITPRARRKLERMRKCARSPEAAGNMRQVERKQAKTRKARRYTPYSCTFGRSPIPCRIIWCESRGSWTARNPSGAIGRFQLLGKGAPWPANTWERRRAHERIAFRLFAGGAGASHWAACL